MHKKREGLFAEVYKVVRTIPKGKVVTYGQLAIIMNDELRIMNKGKVTPRIVGFALHANKDPEVPCHRVVDRNGRLAPNFAFDGPKEQKRRLLAEGVGFVDEDHVDLDKFAWQQK